jgi:hypothetical protein
VNTSLIQNPEEGRVYLIRRRIGGSAQKRFEPARVIERLVVEDLAGGSTGYKLEVLWLYDSKQERIPELYGSIKELTQRWVQAEYEAAITEELTVKAKRASLGALLCSTS